MENMPFLPSAFKLVQFVTQNGVSARIIKWLLLYDKRLGVHADSSNGWPWLNIFILTRGMMMTMALGLLQLAIQGLGW